MFLRSRWIGHALEYLPAGKLPKLLRGLDDEIHVLQPILRLETILEAKHIDIPARHYALIEHLQHSLRSHDIIRYDDCGTAGIQKRIKIGLDAMAH